MATKSVLKSIHIKEKKPAVKLIQAMERAERKNVRKVIISKSCVTLGKEEIKSLFGAANR